MSNQQAPDDQPTTGMPPGNAGGDARPTVPMSSGGGAGGVGEQPGDWIGPFKLLERIGEGGFGTVWLAERREPIVQRVALKVIKPGMDTRAVVARFEQERQALAVMDHPFIAKVFDAGATPAGRPYFVMEHVAGEPITLFADRLNLNVRERLQLFESVCEAVQHAHLKGIIHRDIKPSNILVVVRDGMPHPKVIDFGVAKAITHTLTEKTIFTESGQLVGTPEYMSPEQAEMGATDIDTRTDVYSLGVVLYELLSGSLPFDSKTLRNHGFAAICKVLREQDPPKPSTRVSTADAASGTAIAKRRQTERAHLASELRRELDWIPLKALRKERTQRYQSPADLARDVRNYLEGRPLEAGPESAAYRVKKYVRRNKGPVAAGAAVLVAVLLGLVGTLSQARRADERATAALKAEAEARTAEAEQRRLAESESAARKKAVAAAETIERNAYFASVEMAGAALQVRQFDRARRSLDACPPHLRGWEWGWVDATADTSLRVLRGHTGDVWCAAFSPDGTRIVTASDDRTARLWDAATSAPLAVLNGHTDRVYFSLFSPDGARILTASWDKTARMWDARTGASLFELKEHNSPVLAAAFSPDGTRIFTGGQSGIGRLWDAATGERLAEVGPDVKSFYGAAFSPDGSRLATGSPDGFVRFWDPATGAHLAEFKLERGWPASVDFSPDGTRIVTASWDHNACVFDASNFTLLAESKAKGNGRGDLLCGAKFSPDGSRIVTASHKGTADVWDASTGDHLMELRGHTDEVRFAEFNPNGTLLITASRDDTARIWDFESADVLSRGVVHAGGLRSGAFSPDGARFVTACNDGTARVWSTALGVCHAELKGHTMSLYGALFSPDGTRIVTASKDDTARVWDVATGASLAELKHGGNVYTAVFSRDGTRILTGSGDGTARVWNAATGASLLELGGHTKVVGSAAFSPDGTRIVTASNDNTARVWDATTGATLAEFTGHTSAVDSAEFSPDGTRILTRAIDNTVRVWDAATGTSLAELKGHTEGVWSAAFSSDGTRIVTASSDRTARVWDAATGASLAVLRGHTHWVRSAAFSPDGTRIVTAGQDHSVRVWDAVTGAGLAELTGHANLVSGAVFSPDGTAILSVSAENTARIWSSIPYRQRLPAILEVRREIERTAEAIDARLAAGETLEALTASLAADVNASPRVRANNESALARLTERRLRHDAEVRKLNLRAWFAVRYAPVTPKAAADALETARRASRLAPDNADILNTVGVALYRLGELEQALAVLERTDRMQVARGIGQQPSDWAFIAMAHWKLGRKEQARAAFETFQTLAAGDLWKENVEVLAWKKELDEMIPSKP